jgi:S1-C subfamily serine protease
MDERSRSDADGPGRSRRWFLWVVGGAAAGLAGCSGSPTANDDGQADTTTSDESTETDATDTPLGTSPYTEVYRETIDSVVLLRVFSSTRGGQGSGLVWDDQHVVTNQHVVEGGEEIEVRFSEGDWRAGKLVGTDVYSDLAVVRVENMPDYASPLELVESDPQIGTEVVALGNPFGLGQSVSAGIVSGLDRSLPGPNDFQIPDAIQTDAAVNPGNSGGPLITLDGKVVGLISSGGGENIGFAISAGLMKRVIPDLIAEGEYEHAYMGVRLLGVSPAVAEANGLERVTGVIIVDVLDGGPSDGILQPSTDRTVVKGVRVPVGGDVVVDMGGQPIPSQDALSTYLALETSPGDTIPVEVIRDGRHTTVDLTLGDRPEA